MGAIVSMVYIIGMLLIWFAPETRGKLLPETVDDVWRGRRRDRAEGFEPVMAAPVGAERR